MLFSTAPSPQKHSDTNDDFTIVSTRSPYVRYALRVMRYALCSVSRFMRHPIEKTDGEFQGMTSPTGCFPGKVCVCVCVWSISEIFNHVTAFLGCGMPPVESYSAVSYGPTSSVSVYYFLFNRGNFNEAAIIIKFCCCPNTDKDIFSSTNQPQNERKMQCC